MILLDFEKPIGEVLNQIDRLKQVAEESQIDASATLRELEHKFILR